MSAPVDTAPPRADAGQSPTGQADAAAALIAANRRRRRIRRWIAIGTLPVTLFALVFVGKLLSMYAFAHQSISSYVVGEYAASESAARGQEWWNAFERYKAPYDVGTALAGAERLPEARAKLEEALDLAQGLEVCAVRINLSLVIERMGDAAQADGDAAKAAQLFGEALEITVGTPKECSSDEAQDQSPDQNRDMSNTLKDAKDRQQQKQQQSQQEDQQQKPDQGKGDGEPKPDEGQPSQEKLDDVEKKLGEGAQEREDQLGGGGNGGQDGGGGGAEKPW
ncbi:hypothetical protein [Microbacterium sp.]|uniref:hypothetical protein n=1 Tax=Microbacterium sp. TaxID=51671 RepID=UPI00333E286A